MRAADTSAASAARYFEARRSRGIHDQVAPRLQTWTADDAQVLRDLVLAIVVSDPTPVAFSGIVAAVRGRFGRCDRQRIVRALAWHLHDRKIERGDGGYRRRGT